MKNILLLLQILIFLTSVACNDNKVKEHSQTIKEKIEEEIEEEIQKVRPSDDAVFMTDFSQKELLGIEIGKLSVKNAESKEVIDFTHRLILEHLEINQDLISLAKAKGISIPDSLEIISKVKLIDLKELKGKEFDEKLLEKIIKYHKKDLNKLEKYRGKTKDKELVQWIDNTILLLKNQLQEAQSIETKITNKL